MRTTTRQVVTTAGGGWMSLVLWLAGIYNLLWGAAVVLFPLAIFRLTGLAEPLYPSIWQCVGMIVGVYGVGYILAAGDPVRHYPIVLVGLLGKIFGPIGFVVTASRGELPWTFAWTLLTNDLIWWVPFGIIVWRGLSEPAGQFVGNDDEPDVREALERFTAQDGRSLADHSREQGLMIVFLRHAGCTFCREALVDLRDQREAIRADGLRITLVHMGDESHGRDWFEQYDMGDCLRVSDPERRLYRAFELRRGSLAQLFSLRVTVRGIAGLFRGHGVGRPIGDGFQMPGVFIVRDGAIVGGYRHALASDRPNYAGLAAGCVDGTCDVPALSSASS